MMKTYSQLLATVDRTFQFSPIRLLAIALLSTALPTTVAAQTNDTSASQATSRPSQITQARITQAIDEKQLVILRGNVHPLAQTKFDQGAASDAQPLDRMLLLLQRAPEQEAALSQLLDDQLTINSPN